jgi:hypothetical protein
VPQRMRQPARRARRRLARIGAVRRRLYRANRGDVRGVVGLVTMAAGTSIQREAVAHGVETSPKAWATARDGMVGGIGFVTLPHAPGASSASSG